MDLPFDDARTLEELEGDDWADAEVDSHLVKTCHRLRKVPVRDLANQDLRILIGQNIGLGFLIPRAIEGLYENVFLLSELYEGDLLVALLSVEPGFWRRNRQLRQAVVALAAEAKKRLSQLTGDARGEVEKALRHFGHGE